MSSFLNAGQAACTVITKRQAPPLPQPTIPPRQAPRLLDQLRERIRYLQKSGSGLKYKPLITRQPASRNPSARAINWLTLATVKPIAAAKAVIVRPLSV